MIGNGLTSGVLSDEQAKQIVSQAVSAMAPAGKKILIIVPDHTRTCPIPLLSRALQSELLAAKASRVDFIIALGTHPAMEQAQIETLFGVGKGGWEKTFGPSQVFNHEWKNKDMLAPIGKLSSDEVCQISGGLFKMDVEVTINRRIFDYDQVLVLGPVFPHEVVGFSGGNKYFFPGICGEELLNFFHWLGAVITNPRIIGNKYTPVRATIDRAAAILKMQKFALCLVVTHEGLAGMFFGTPEEAWSPAADLSSKVHVVWVDRPYQSILAKAPKMYDDIWTGGKCMYKMEPVVADGGELIIYAPHITEISYVHGHVLDQIGYHTRDYFLSQWEKFKHFPWGVVAHSTHVRGIGKMEDGLEKCRVKVTLATGIPERRCTQVNLGYRDPASIDVSEWEGQESQGRLYVAKAGEMLYKLNNGPAWQRA